MPYSRFADADVHVVLHVDRYFECSGCLFLDHVWVPDASVPLGGHVEPTEPTPTTTFYTTDEIIDHLGLHRLAGHHVPDTVLATLERDRAHNDAWIAARTKT